MSFEPTSTRLWKHLTREERLLAATAFWKEPPREMLGAALAAIVKARHLRPQVARSMSPEEQARALAAVSDPGEMVAASLLVALHLGGRRPLLGTFLDAVGLPHEDGILKEAADEAPPVSVEAARRGVEALLASHPPRDVWVYLNTLHLQDPERWSSLAEVAPEA